MKEYSSERFWEDLRNGQFAKMVKESARGKTVQNPEHVYNIMKPLFAEKPDVERVFGIFLDGSNHVIAIEVLAQGSIGSSAVYPREVVKAILRHKATSLVLSHNHPSGDVKPSKQDIELTYRLMLAAAVIDAIVFDHIICGSEYMSMSSDGILDGLRRRVNRVMYEDSL